MSEADGEIGSQNLGSKRGKGPLFTERWENYQNCRKDLDALRIAIDSQVADNQTQIATLQTSAMHLSL